MCLFVVVFCLFPLEYVWDLMISCTPKSVTGISNGFRAQNGPKCVCTPPPPPTHTHTHLTDPVHAEPNSLSAGVQPFKDPGSSGVVLMLSRAISSSIFQHFVLYCTPIFHKCNHVTHVVKVQALFPAKYKGVNGKYTPLI